MTTAVEPIPTDYPVITPYLHVDGAADAIDFYTQVLGATERMRIGAPGGKIGHAELVIGTSMIMLSDEFPEMDAAGPRTVGGTPVSIHVYVTDADAAHDRAVKAGAKSLRPVEKQFYGDRSGQFEDPFGHRWSVATHVEDVPAEELARRAAEVMGGAADDQS
ncbi:MULTISPECIES: glyoxalase/bleomycin resistance/extradiol dioxygenase family protein [unclassified Frankia]|uniref:VOC family protein n=1 Tax=unclassified Frankia TaxID=2632575 RepID=UPI001EF45917|nr:MULTISPECIES: VOC family protein [unclassified Frankia]